MPGQATKGLHQNDVQQWINNMRCQLKQDGHEKPNYRELTENTHCVIPRYLGILSGIQGNNLEYVKENCGQSSIKKYAAYNYVSIDENAERIQGHRGIL